MGARGPKAASEIALVEDGNVIPLPRPEPLEELTHEQAEEWRKITDSLPADWFTKDTQPVLAQLCRHIVRAREFAGLIEACKTSDEFNLKDFRDLSRAEREQSEIIRSLSTKLRITQQARLDKRTNPPADLEKPWD